MTVVEFRGLAAHYLDEGRGPPVVLLHAGGSSRRQWRKLAGHLQGYRLLAPDLLGCGETPGWEGPEELSHDHQAALVLRMMDAAGVQSAHLVGHSYGGATALRVVVHAPERVRSLVLIEPIAMPLLREHGEAALFESYRAFAQAFIDEAGAGRHEAAWRGFIDLRNGDGTWDGLDDAARSRFLSGTLSTVAGFISNLSNPTTLADCRAISCTTTAVYGTETTAPERRVTELIGETVPGCRLCSVAGAGHMVPLSHPEALARIVLRNLTGHETAPLTATDSGKAE